MSFDDFRVNW